MGSHGDVHPFVGLGRELLGRGHRVTMLTNAHFEEMSRAAGLEFDPVGTHEDYGEAIDHPDLWHPRKAFGIVAEAICRYVRIQFDAVASRYRPGETVVVSGVLAFGSRIAQEKLGVPLVTVHLQPAGLRSVYQTPAYPKVHLGPRVPKLIKRGFYWLLDNVVADPKIAPRVNAFRAELGLPPAKGFIGAWWNSPELIVGMWPEWYAATQRDWPRQLELVGFPLWDEGRVQALAPEVESYLNAGAPPIVFTPGSAMKHGQAFFAAAGDACRILGERGLFVTRFPEQLPNPLPGHVRHIAYAPFSKLFPRARAVVHHGGIGTTAQALAAGAPQIIMPLAHDQFDNAWRVRELGVGASLTPELFKPAAVAEKLRQLQSDRATIERARGIAQRFEPMNALERACESIEAAAREAVSV